MSQKSSVERVQWSGAAELEEQDCQLEKPSCPSPLSPTHLSDEMQAARSMVTTRRSCKITGVCQCPASATRLLTSTYEEEDPGVNRLDVERDRAAVGDALEETLQTPPHGLEGLLPAVDTSFVDVGPDQPLTCKEGGDEVRVTSVEVLDEDRVCTKQVREGQAWRGTTKQQNR